MYKMVTILYYTVVIISVLVSIMYFFINAKKVGYMEYNLKYYTCNLFEKISKMLLKILLFLFALFCIISIYKIGLMLDITKEYKSAFRDWIINNKESFNTILGAFLASFLGIITQVFLNRNNQRREQSKYSKLLYNDQIYIMYNLHNYEMLINSYECNDVKQFDEYFDKINFDYNWRKYYGYIIDKLPITYYNRLVKIYSLAERLNIAIDKKDISNLDRVIKKLKLIERPRSFVDVNRISNEDLLDALQRLSQNKKAKTKILSNLVIEIKIKRMKKKYSTLIKDKIYEFVSTLKETNSTYINDKVKQWLKVNNKEFHKMNDEVIDRIIFEVSLKGKKAKLIFGQYLIDNNITT